MPDYSITEDLLNAIAFVESSNNPQAVNERTGARGLFQFRPIAWKDVQENNKDLAEYEYREFVHDPLVSRKFAKALLELNRKRLGKDASLSELLGSYNWGIGNVKKKGMDKAPLETRQYIDKITTILAQSGGNEFPKQNPITIGVRE